MKHSLSYENYRRLRSKDLTQSDGIIHIPVGAQPINTMLTLTLENVPDTVRTTNPPEVVLTDYRRDYSWRVALSPASKSGIWEAEIRLPIAVTVVTYYFIVAGRVVQERRPVESRATGFGNHPVYAEWQEQPFSIAIYDPTRMSPAWTEGMVVYQIFPDRFAKAQSDEQAQSAMKGVYGHEPEFKAWGDKPEDPPLGRDFYGGDLRGIIDKLDYLGVMGVECLYINPIFEASSNHRYEAIDYFKIDQMLGTEADFDELIAAAHARGIKIILDAVFNHCSSDSIYFDITGKFGDGATQSKTSPYYRWFKFHNWPLEYDCWLDLGFMPEFAESPEVMDYFLGEGGVTEYWLKKGVDGWRADIAAKNTFDFWKQFRHRVDQVKPEAWVVAEEWQDATHYLLGDTFSSAMNYRLAWMVRGFFAMDYLSASEFEERVFIYHQDTPPPARRAMMNVLDSHDTDRLIYACGGKIDRYKQSFAFLFAFSGAPTVFYGSEAALTGKFPEDSRRTMDWDHPNEDLTEFFKKLMNIRKNNLILRHGDMETVLIDDERRLYGLVRHYEGKSVYAVFNASEHAHTIQLTLTNGDAGTWEDLLGNIEPVAAQHGSLTFTLPSRGYVWLAQS